MLYITILREKQFTRKLTWFYLNFNLKHPAANLYTFGMTYTTNNYETYTKHVTDTRTPIL